MELSVIQIGNTKGFRLSKTLIEKYNIKDKGICTHIVVSWISLHLLTQKLHQSDLRKLIYEEC